MPSSAIKVIVYRINNSRLISPLSMVLAGDLAVRPDFSDSDAASIITLRGDDYYVREVMDTLFTSLNTSPAPYPSSVASSATDAKVLPDANYTVANSDKLLILTEPTAVRTLTLPVASTLTNQEINISCKSNTTGRWVLSGSFVQKGTNGTNPIAENFINSGLVTGTDYRLFSAKHVYDGITSWKWYDI